MALLPVIKDWVMPLITVIATAVGIYVALAGLSTWKRQLKGQADHDLARRVLVTLYRYREAIKGLRNPAMSGNEFPLPPEAERNGMSDAQIRYFGLSSAYQNRWLHVRDARIELDTSLLETEALWGDELRSKMFAEVFSLEWSLLVAVRHHLQLNDPNENEETKRVIGKMADERGETWVLYDSLEKDGDQFSRSFAGAIKKVEDFLQPKLGRRKSLIWDRILDRVRNA
jgi:hypothetical protein